jgi:hypothetical protein
MIGYPKSLFVLALNYQMEQYGLYLESHNVFHGFKKGLETRSKDDACGRSMLQPCKWTHALWTY